MKAEDTVGTQRNGAWLSVQLKAEASLQVAAKQARAYRGLAFVSLLACS